jgi:hypothetical protein
MMKCNQDDFWKNLKEFALKIVRGDSSNLFFVMFAKNSYEQTTTSPTASFEIPSIPFRPTCRLGLPFLRFTEGEIDILFEKFITYSEGCVLPKRLKYDVEDFLSYHPGLTVSYLVVLKLLTTDIGIPYSYSVSILPIFLFSFDR